MQRHSPSHSQSVGLGVLLIPIFFGGLGWIGNGVAHFFGWW